MSALDLCVEVLQTGAVRGLGLDARLEAWEEKLDNEYVDDVRKGRSRRDLALIEIAFLKGDDDWRRLEFSLQIRRLTIEDFGVVPAVLIEEFGDFEARIDFNDLQRSATSEGILLDRIRDRERDAHVDSPRRDPVQSSTSWRPSLETSNYQRRGTFGLFPWRATFSRRAVPIV
ncbi:hypothetical protein [Kribbella amoyensis]|uniref:hypothetical protein n=1 Tax=Kribbella amoyensis TaxID=996641 RepID=UPI0011A09111|nr:hypothetical protein [Kribbella amoyensis]